MSLRDKLQFSYDGQALAEACERRRTHHAERREFWDAELATAKAIPFMSIIATPSVKSSQCSFRSTTMEPAIP